ncbi:MAG: LytR C-terminal domain-containing protein [Patescibacteria group bacterium]|uniref:LytR C-terminal domain-containing protein n=1 Tax=candidate division WWE3 bacterium TaxID=2053526 RepID=A0A955ECA3_UNCKA|nr:LytR C-terminal domain-containing protein [candidate division WWE3 bacterium]
MPKAARVGKKSTAYKQNSKKSGQVINKTSLHYIFACVFALIFLVSFGTYKIFTIDFASANSDSTFIHAKQLLNLHALILLEVSDEFDTQDASTYLLKSVKVVFYEKKTGNIDVLTLNSKALVDYPKKIGEESLDKSLQLGYSVADKKMDYGSDYARVVVQQYLGYPIDDYVLYKTSNKDLIDSMYITSGGLSTLSSVWSVGLSSSTFENSIDSKLFLTSMSFKDYLSLYRGSLATQTNVTNGIDFDEPAFDTYVQSLYARNPSDFVSGSSVAILNSTNISGLAKQGSRVVQNSGGYLLTTDNARENYDKTTLIIDSYDNPYAYVLYRYFDMSLENVRLIKDSTQILEPILDRADVTLIISFDNSP